MSEREIPETGLEERTDEDIDDLIEEWHTVKPLGVPLWAFLGWTKDEYSWWVLSGERPQSD